MTMAPKTMPRVGTERRTRSGGASSKSASTARRASARNPRNAITAKYRKEETCVALEAEARVMRKITRRAVRTSPGRFNEASFATAVKRSRCETERSSPCRSVSTSKPSHNRYATPMRFRIPLERRGGRAAQGRKPESPRPRAGLQARERLQDPAPLRPAARGRNPHVAGLESDLPVAREEEDSLPGAARDPPFELHPRGRVLRVRQGIVERQDDHTVPLRFALSHDPMPHPRRLFPVEIARVIARHEVAQHPDFGASASPARMRPASARVLGRHHSDAARFRHRVHHDLAGQPRVSVLAEEPEREARQQAGVGILEDAPPRKNAFHQDLAKLPGL